ncbi:MAG: UDP-N-acetylmuramoyl-tripeptide--D-alanyl-D-alanine ligase [Bacteroidia bacterium]|nr:UDP-N-acetylmuramoyl-tripeptide--D-alanyl-D-alanine ligase [Bacteroidia bacterium]
MVQGRLGEAATIMGGEMISGSAAAMWRGATLDSRQVTGGELFFALAGERTDGHRFVGQALERGAAAVIIERSTEIPVDGGAIRVPDTLEALHALTREVRTREPRKLVGITGSVGKTTTKEMLAAMLARRFRVARNPGSLNNTLGFPVALLGIPEGTEWMVAEMGMSTPGELRQVSWLGKPDVAVFLNVYPAHLEAFGSLEAIREAKAELLDGLAEDGLVIANQDDTEVVEIARRHSGRVIWFGRQTTADHRVEEVESLTGGRFGSRFKLVLAGEAVEVELSMHGLYNVDNFLAAAACAHALGIPLAEIAEAAEAVKPPPMRGVVHRLANGSTVVDDCYNSNPAALTEALQSALEIPGERHWAILGDMLELGGAAEEFHLQAGKAAATMGFSPVVGVGSLARNLVEGARLAGAESYWYEDAAAAAVVAAQLRGGDTLLIKGSRGIGLEVVVGALLAAAEEVS